MEAANCSQAAKDAFCHNTSCIAKLAASCRSQSDTCVGCASCSHAHFNNSGCDLAQQVEFCVAVVPPQPAMPPSCDEVLAGVCDQSRKEGPTGCVLCAGEHHAAVKAANCTNTAIASFCSNSSCFTQLHGRCVRPAVGESCSHCAHCALLFAPAHACKESEIRSFCTPVPPKGFEKVISRIANVTAAGLKFIESALPAGAYLVPGERTARS
eukprot:COSAG05_NODE_4823_length_1358_cov_1.417792_2_plen_211_part_00